FPGKDQASAFAPKNLVRRRHRAEDAARAFVGPPDFAADAGVGCGHANGPRHSRTLGLTHRTEPGAGDAQKGDTPAIRRPRWLAVKVGAGVEEAQRGGVDVVE